jgi:RNA polymerase sigma-70 factor (ECF subfamily)
MVARSRALDHLRARRSRKKHETAAREDAVEGTEDSGISALLFQNELQTQMKTCLEMLPDQQRSLIDMCFYGGLSHREVAQSLGIPLGTVKTRIRSALMQLAEAMEPVD